MKVDLHLHTTASDGSKTPSQMLDWAKRSGLDACAITDHDSVSGLDEAFSAGRVLGIKVLTGIEISTFSNCEIHILGYNFDYKNPVFLEELERMKDMRKYRNSIIKQKLDGIGIHVDINVTADGIGRLNIARKMVEQKIVRDINEAFDRYLGPKGSVYTEVKRTTPLEAVKLISRFGGISSIAHPRTFLQDRRLEPLVSGLKPFGLSGIEVFYPSHNEGDRRQLIALADKYSLVATGGSDYHGDEDKKFQIELPDKSLRALHLI